MMNDLFFLNESDDEEEKKKEYDDNEKDEDDEFNSLINDDDEVDIDEDKDDNFNNLIDNNKEDCCDDVYNKALKVAYAMTIFTMNIKYIQLNTVGDLYSIGWLDNTKYTVESFTQLLYELATESQSIDIDNPIHAKEHCENMSVANEKEYTICSAVKFIDKNIHELLDYLNCLRDALNVDVEKRYLVNRCEQEIGNLAKCSNFYIRKMLAGESTPTDNSKITSYNNESYSYNDLF